MRLIVHTAVDMLLQRLAASTHFACSSPSMPNTELQDYETMQQSSINMIRKACSLPSFLRYDRFFVTRFDVVCICASKPANRSFYGLHDGPADAHETP
jgi:hypothetical protein